MKKKKIIAAQTKDKFTKNKNVISLLLLSIFSSGACFGQQNAFSLRYVFR